MDDFISILDTVTKQCPEEGGCLVLPLVRENLMEGNWGTALRYLRQPGGCGVPVHQCPHSPEQAALLNKTLVTEEKTRLMTLWEQAFSQKPLEIDFVCNNPIKLKALTEAMAMSDIIPLTFSIQEHPSGRRDVMRVTVEP